MTKESIPKLPFGKIRPVYTVYICTGDSFSVTCWAFKLLGIGFCRCGLSLLAFFQMMVLDLPFPLLQKKRLEATT